jgi:hypothetical protein
LLAAANHHVGFAAAGACAISLWCHRSERKIDALQAAVEVRSNIALQRGHIESIRSLHVLVLRLQPSCPACCSAASPSTSTSTLFLPIQCNNQQARQRDRLLRQLWPHLGRAFTEQFTAQRKPTEMDFARRTMQEQDPAVTEVIIFYHGGTLNLS